MAHPLQSLRTLGNVVARCLVFASAESLRRLESPSDRGSESYLTVRAHNLGSH